MIVVKLVTFMLLFTVHHCRLPDKVYCVNEQCNEPISKARTILNYNSGDIDLMSFRGNSEALIYMKSAGSNPDLWYATINGKSGFVSSRFLKENKIYVKEPAHILPVQVKKPEVQPDKVQQAHEVVEGTTLYSTDPSVTDNVPEDTAGPLNTLSNEESTPITSPNPDQAVDNINIWNQKVTNQPELENVEPSNTGEAGVTTPLPPTEPGSDNSLPEASQLHIETPATETPANIEDDKASNENVVTSSETDVPKSTETINEFSGNLNIVMKQDLPPIQDKLPLPESVVSGDIGNAEVYDMPKQMDLTQHALNQPEVTDSLESNISNSVNTIDTQPQAELQNNVPNNGPTQPDQVPQFDNSLFNSVFQQEGVVNVNGEVSNTVSQDKVPNPAKQNIPEMHKEIESIPTSAESITTSTESLPILPESILTTAESDPILTESVPNLPESIPVYSENIPTSTESISTTTESTPLINKNGHESIENTESLTQEASNLYNLPMESALNQQSQESSNYYSYSTEPTPTSDDYNAPSNSDYTEDSLNVEDVITTPKPDAYVSAEDSGGFISRMLSSVSSMWQSATPEPAKDNTDWEANIAPPPAADQKEESFSFFSYLLSTYNSIMGTQELNTALFASTGETCYTEDYCDGSGSSLKNSRLLTFLLTSASAVVLFTLGYYYLDNRKQDSKLIGNINSLQRDLLFTTKECEILKEELTTTKNKLSGIEDSSFGMDDMVLSLKEEINELKAQNERLRHSLDDNEKLLRVSENTAGELQNTLGEVENTLSDLFAERANSEEQIAELNGKIQAFEEELISVTRERDNYQLKYVSAETALEESKKQKMLLEELNEKLKEANNTINLQKHEILALKDALRELKNGLSPNVDIGSLIDHTEIQAKLAKALEERKTFESKYEVESKEKSRLAEELDIAQGNLRTTSQQATEASTRLEVLEKYFQERESELMKELSAKESLYLSKKGESASTVEKMELLQQEIQRFKEKCDALALELAEQESLRRTAVSEVEARAHAAWLEARGARRDADAARDEASALRRKLAALSAADGAASPHRQVSSPLEGVDGVVPPPLPLAFLPPPLLPPLPRPPPLGRLPSPHPPRYNDRRYSPDSRYSPESRYSPASRYSPETVRYSPDSRYSPRRREAYSPRRRYNDGRTGTGSRSRNGPPPPDTETEYNSDSPSRERRRPPPRYGRHSGPSSGSGCSSESDK